MSVRSRSSERSTLRLIVSGRLSRPVGSAGLEIEPELGRDHDLVADGLERFADELFVRERPVDLRGVEERDAVARRRCGSSAIISPRSGIGR